MTIKLALTTPPPEGTLDPSILSLDYTYVWSRYSCISNVYFIHISFAYLIVASGLMAMISRLIPALRPYHSLFGKVYLLAMFWAFASAILVHNVGLAMPIIVSFLYLLSGLTIGLPAIYIHSRRYTLDLPCSVPFSVSLSVLDMLRERPYHRTSIPVLLMPCCIFVSAMRKLPPHPPAAMNPPPPPACL